MTAGLQRDASGFYRQRQNGRFSGLEPLQVLVQGPGSRSRLQVLVQVLAVDLVSGHA